MIVFLTLYLGLISGKQPVALQADAAVKSIRLIVDGATVGTLDAPPWRGEVDFGGELLPHQIVAVGLDVTGHEIARASQFVNVPRPIAEIDVALARDAAGTPVRASLVGRHLAQEKPRSATMKLDDAVLRVDTNFAAALPAIDMKRPHALAAEMHFADGTVARREIVFGGQFAETAEAQLTPIAVVRTGASDAMPAEGCFVADGVPLRVRSIEAAPQHVIVVRDPDPDNLKRQLKHGILMNSHLIANLDVGTLAQLLTPVPSRKRTKEEPTILFPVSGYFDGSKLGMLYLLTVPHDKRGASTAKMWSDAVAVAGVRAAGGGRRRAVVLVIDDNHDRSDYQPGVVRRYLASLGVPLLVWSTGHPPPPASWGDVEDIASLSQLTAATERLRRALDAQRIAWVEADPLTALRAEVKEGCGYTRLAR